MKKINQDIKEHTFERFYLLYGEEDYLKLQYKDKLVSALVSVDDNMNYTVYEGKNIDVPNLLETGETLPFFSDNRVIVVENSGLFKKTPDDFTKRLEQFPESTHVIFVEKETDGRNKLWSWFKNNGYKCEMKTPSEGELRKWVGKLCKDEGKQIYENAVEVFFGSVGLDMFRVKNELEKVFSYCADKDEITEEDIRAVCSDEAEDTMFAMIEAIGNREQKRALTLYRNLLMLKSEPMVILANLSRHMKSMLEVSTLLQEGRSMDEAASVLGRPKWQLNQYKKQMRNFSEDDLKKMLERCQDTDYGIKTGNIKGIVGAELLIIEFSSMKAKK